MKTLLLSFCIIFLVGCGSKSADSGQAAGTTGSTDGTAKVHGVTDIGGKGKVTAEQIGLPFYPGAEEVSYSGIAMNTDMGQTYGVSFLTKDSPSQVQQFYKTEGAKVGKLKEDVPTGPQLKIVGIDRTDGSTSAVQAMTGKDGLTILTMHRLIPKK